MRAAVPQKKNKEGSSMGARARVESRQGAGNGEKTNYASEQGECGIAKRELNASGVLVSTASAGVDACVARSNRTLGLGHGVNLSVSITLDYSNTNFSLLLFSLFRNRINSVASKKHYFINPLWIFR